MSKASIRATIESRKGDIARLRADIATQRSRKSELNARYAAQIKNASTASAKAGLRTQKASAVAYIEGCIRTIQANIATKQRDIASLRERLKYEK